MRLPTAGTDIMDMISYGLVGITDQKPATAIPPFDAVIETIAEMLDHFLAPPEGADSAAGKRVIAAWAGKIQDYFDGVESTRDSEGKGCG